MIEEWKPIRGYEGLYEISSLGRARSLDRILEYTQTNQYDKVGKVVRQKFYGAILTPRSLKTGYLRYQLQNKDFYAHRLVCANFLRPLRKGEEVNHKDGDKKNNSLSNLEIVSRTENQDHAYHTGLNDVVPYSKKILLNGVFYESLGEASRSTGIPSPILGTALKKGRKEWCGYKYKFSIEECRD